MKLREYRMAFEPGARVIDLEGADLGLRSKLGGEPEWDQDNDTPKCTSCREDMSFVAQLDSIEHEADNNPHAVGALSGNQHYMFGDVGVIYVFFCFECSEAKAVFQCA